MGGYADRMAAASVDIQPVEAQPQVGLYTITLKGEEGTYELRGSREHTLNEVCKVVSDLTGYNTTFLFTTALADMKLDEKRSVSPASGYRSVPQFVIERVA